MKEEIADFKKIFEDKMVEEEIRMKLDKNWAEYAEKSLSVCFLTNPDLGSQVH